MRSNDDSVLWKVGYDAQGRVDQIISPTPSVGEAPITKRYAYHPDPEAPSTTIWLSASSKELAIETLHFEPLAWRPRVLESLAKPPATSLYDQDGEFYGEIGAAGLQTTIQRDPFGNVVAELGPAPLSWFDERGGALADYADQIPTKTYTFDTDPASHGLLAMFYDSQAPGAAPFRQQILNEDSPLPPGLGADGWTMLASGDFLLPDDVTTEWELQAPQGLVGTSLMVGSARCALGDVCTMPASSTPQGQHPVSVSIEYVSGPGAPSSVPFAVHMREEGESSWSPVSLKSARVLHAPSSETMKDTFSLLGPLQSVTQSMVYDDILLGLIAEVQLNGKTTLRYRHEPVEPLAGQLGRVTSRERPSGLTTTMNYYGPQEVVADPFTGDAVTQGGALQSIQVENSSRYSQIYGRRGHVVATYRDGEVLGLSEYDKRQRLTYIEIPEGPDATLSPARTLQHTYGAEGDPRKTVTIQTIDARVLTETVTVDLFGRVRQSTDPWGIQADVHYDAFGLPTLVAHQHPASPLVTQTFEYDDLLRLDKMTVTDLAGVSYWAKIHYDGHHRPEQIDYSNETRVTYAYDPDTGAQVEQEYTDGDGQLWSDTLLRSLTGRVLQHTLSAPTGTATQEYDYDPSTGALLQAELVGTGVVPSATWQYGYDYDTEGSEACASHNRLAAMDGARTRRVMSTKSQSVRLDYCYDLVDAPAALKETTTPTEGTPVVRAVPLSLEGQAITQFETATLRYDRLDALVQASEAGTVLTYVRDATGAIVESDIDQDGEHTVQRATTSGWVLDQDDNIISHMIALPGGVRIRVAQDVTWAYLSLAGHQWWNAGPSGRHDGQIPAVYSPDGEPVVDEQEAPSPQDPTDPLTAVGWNVGSQGRSLGLQTPLIEFGARLYIPTLGAFSTMDPIPNAGLTPFVYADNDPINLHDPSGANPVKKWFEDTNIHKWSAWKNTFTDPEVQMVIGISGLVFGAGSTFFFSGVLALALSLTSALPDVIGLIAAIDDNNTQGIVMYSMFIGMTLASEGFAGRAAIRKAFISLRQKAPLKLKNNIVFKYFRKNPPKVSFTDSPVAWPNSRPQLYRQQGLTPSMNRSTFSPVYELRWRGQILRTPSGQPIPNGHSSISIPNNPPLVPVEVASNPLTSAPIVVYLPAKIL